MSREAELLAILDAAPMPLGFLTRQQRRALQAGIDALIDYLDAVEPDADLEPSLGAPEVEFSDVTARVLSGGHIDQRRWCDGATFAPTLIDLELDKADDEPVLGEPERHPSKYATTLSRSGDQTAWGRGFDADEREDVSEDEGACISSQPHDDEEPEPSLGSPEIHHDQRRWGQGSGSVEGDHDEEQWCGSGILREDLRQRARNDVRAMLRRKGLGDPDRGGLIPIGLGEILLHGAV